MLAYNNQELKSNLNTSCASNLDCSLFSSVGAYSNKGESLAKICELQKMFIELCSEEKEIDDQKKSLTSVLEGLKRRLDDLIMQKFGPEKVNPKIPNILLQNFENNYLKCDRIIRPGSITKTNRMKNSSNEKSNNNPLFYYDEPTFYMKTQQKTKNIVGDFRINDKLELKDCKKIGSHKKIMSNFQANPTDSELNLRKETQITKYMKEGYIDFEQQGRITFNIWAKNIPNFDIKEQTQHRIKKSYLSSPRSSLVSPRSFLG